jgi:16S rRNA C967 or C1407 C5-methylase (RsmB/RsmF family)
VGGQLVYTTCTKNPIENQAVVCEIHPPTKGARRLVDVQAVLPGLKRRPGIDTWKVIDEEEKELHSAEDGSSNKMIKPTMFPPTKEEAAGMNLERCIRCLPQDQDTGGFFICLFEKVRKGKGRGQGPWRLPVAVTRGAPVVIPRCSRGVSAVLPW